MMIRVDDFVDNVRGRAHVRRCSVNEGERERPTCNTIDNSSAVDRQWRMMTMAMYDCDVDRGSFQLTASR